MDCGTLGAAAASPGKHGAAAAAAPGKAEEAAGRDSVSWLSPHFAWGGRAKLVVCRARQAGAAAASMLGVGGAAAAAAAAAAWGGIARPLTRETPDLPGFGEPLAPLWRGLDARECICATTASCACHWQSARHLSTVSSIFRNMNMMIHLRSCRIYLLCCLVFACFISSLAEDHAAGSHQANVRLDRNMVQDKDHIMEHLEGVIDKPESEMSPQELQLHYFKMHDYDGNNLLDGLELATAISHVHKEEGGEHTQIMKEDDLISLIDDVLQDDDKNNDGYIDYAEFAKSLE